ncbi:MAG: PAS domain S-box protein [Campylobacterales bacterium]|nr:PAS domain S-box protein [Campylobacterales bacterium]
MANTRIDSTHYQIPIDFLPLNVAVYRYSGEDFMFVDFNTMAEETEGFKKEDLLGKNLCDMFPAVKEFGLYEVLLRVHEQGGHETFEKSFYRDERVSGWRKNEIIKLPNGDIMAIYEDLTQAKQLEEENHRYLCQLEESEDKFRNIAENALMGIFIYGDRYLYVNDAFASMIGYTKEELYSMEFWKIIEKSDQNKVKEAAKRRLMGEQFELAYSDIKLVTKAGHIKIMRVSTRTIKYEGHFAGMGTIIDITDIKETKEQLKMLAQAIEQTDDLVKIININGHILFVNDSMLTHSGYTRSELIGTHTRIFKSGRHNKSFYTLLWNTITSGNTYRDTFINRKKDGTFFYEEETITPIFDENKKIEYYISTGKDVSSRVVLENALRESEANFRNIFNKSSDGIVILDMEGNLLEVNRIMCERLGYDKEELIGENLTFIDTPKAQENIPIAMKLLQENGHVMFEAAHRTKDGTIIPVEVHATLIEYIHNPAILSAVRDITERKLNEQALRDAEDLYHRMFDLSPVGILLIDPETGNAVEFNKISHEALGYSAEEFSQLHVMDYEAIESPEDTQAHIEALKSGNPEVFETQHRTKKGEIRDVTVSVQLIEFKGKPHLFSMYHDITSLKQYEQTLKTLSLRLSLATQAASIGVWEWDLESNTLTWDDRMYTIYGIEKDPNTQPYAMWHDAVDSQDIDRAEASLQRAIRGEGDYNTQFWITTPQKERHFVQAMGTVERDNAGDVIRVVGVNWDITKQKEYEQVLEIAKQSAEAANIAKSNFLANMSHEIRTPMNAILGMIQLTHTLDLPQEGEEYLKKIEKSSKILLHIINDILDFSKIEANRLEITPIVFNLNETIDQLSSLFAPKSDAKGLEFIIRIASEIPTWLIGDNLRLLQILNNLVSNAIKFTHSGEIELSLSVEKIVAERITINFAVRDTGIGISPKDHYKLFTMFSQADESITRKYGGTGLGLSISKRLAELMGGTLEFFSEEGKGSTFTFTAEFGITDMYAAVYGSSGNTALQNVQPESNDIIAISAPIRGASVLLVEDNEINIHVESAFLHQMGIKVTVVTDGLQAVSLLKNERFDGILMDYQMPIMDGIEATEVIRQRGDDTPIIAMTAAAMQSDKEACLQAGMNDYLSKPIDIIQLAQVLTQWIAPRLHNNEAFHDVASIPSGVVLPEAIEGIDLRVGLTNSAGNRDLYHRILVQFYHQYAQGCEPLETMLNHNQRIDAKRWVHTLKGSSATIGADLLNAKAKAVELELNNNKSVDMKELCTALVHLKDLLAPLDEANTLRHSRFNYPVSIQQLNAIRKKLSNSQLVEQEEIDSLEEVLGHYINVQHWNTLRNALEIFDYEKAQNAATALQTFIKEKYEFAN